MKKFILIVLGLLGLLLIGMVIYVSSSWVKDYDASFPDISASTYSAIIARGKYLAYGPAHCATCHVPMDKLLEVEAGLQMPLIGGWEINIPPGEFRAPNLTPDPETGIANLSDSQIARSLRYSVGHNGRLLIPVMPFQDLSDEDLTAIISFLRSQEPVKNKVEPSKFSFLGKALLAFNAITPVQPRSTPPARVAMDTSVQHGSYIANSVANCYGCHTKVDLKTGDFIGEPFAGGFHIPPEAFSKGYSFVSPNITPNAETGIMATWNEETFVERFKAGRVYEGSPMPWGSFSRMTEGDIRAVYRYLQSIDPVKNKIDQIVFPPEE